jgi:Ca-activated chloride channel family protein
VLVGLLGGLQVSGHSQSPLPTFRASIEVVPISAVVRDRRGRLVTTLTRSDFEVFDNGERRAIVDFQADRMGPVTLAILMDMSGSMRAESKAGVVRMALKQFSNGLREGVDEVGLFTFDTALDEQQAFTAHPPLLDSVLVDAQPFGTTSLYDAIGETARRLGTRASLRRAVVVLTDGIDTSSTLTPQEVAGLASSIDVPVYVIVTAPAIDRLKGRDGTSARSAQSEADLRDLAELTGGELLWATRTDEAILHGHRILLDLRHRYLLAIESSTAERWRPIDVRVRDPRLTVRARHGYFSGDRQIPR